MPKITLRSGDVLAETLLITLYARAMESQMPAPLLRDYTAVRLVEQIDANWARYKLQAHDQVGLIMRMSEFDRLTQDFLAHHPQATVVHIGCGLDTRFERVDNGQVEWFDLDLPEVIALRRQLLPERPRCHMLGCSVFDPTWLDLAGTHAGRPFLFLAEGVLPYFSEEQVRGLVLMLNQRFGGAELACDAMTPLMVRMHNLELLFLRIGARLRWGLAHGRDVESWGPGIQLLSEWFYFDRPEPRLGASRWMRYVPPFARGVGVFHYRLGMGVTG